MRKPWQVRTAPKASTQGWAAAGGAEFSPLLASVKAEGLLEESWVTKARSAQDSRVSVFVRRSVKAWSLAMLSYSYGSPWCLSEGFVTAPP